MTEPPLTHEVRERQAGSSSPLLVWGAGAMGGTIGGVLVKEGWPVVFVDRAQEHVQAMNDGVASRRSSSASKPITPKRRWPS
jgi:ketopantoate reductase